MGVRITEMGTDKVIHDSSQGTDLVPDFEKIKENPEPVEIPWEEPRLEEHNFKKFYEEVTSILPESPLAWLYRIKRDQLYRTTYFDFNDIKSAQDVERLDPETVSRLIDYFLENTEE